MIDHDDYPDSYLREILSHVKSIAILGASDDPERPSYEVLSYLQERGYGISAVNPKLAGQAILTAPVFGSLAEVPAPIDMIDVFRNNAAVAGIIEEILTLPHRPAVLWMQIGVRVDDAARKAEAAGIKVVMDRCPKIEISRLFGRSP